MAAVMLGAVPSVNGAAVNSPRLGHAVPAEALGETLMGELNCVACHAAESVASSRLASKQAPRLGGSGVSLSPEYIRSFLHDPIRDGGTMPNVLHGLDESEKETVIDGLVHYLVSQQSDDYSAPSGLDEFKLEQGRQLYHSVGCVACHSPQETPSELEKAELGSPDLSGTALETQFGQSSVPFGHLAGKTSVTALAKFLENPLESRPAGRMPSLGLSASESQAIAMYLARGQATGLFDPNQPLERVPGLRYTYIEFGNNEHSTEGYEDFADHFPGDLPDSARDFLRVAGSGIVDRVTDAVLKRPEQVGLLFHGSITISVPGEYTFYINSDDGSRLYVGSEWVVNNDNDHGPVEKAGKIRLGIGDHPFKVTYYNRGGGGELKASFEGPGLSKQEIPADRFTYRGQAMKPLGMSDFRVDVDKARLGRRHFVSYGCAQCHDGDPALQGRSVGATALTALRGRTQSGCLSAQPSDRAVSYRFDPEERAAIATVLSNAQNLSNPRTDADKIQHSMTQLNCYACHARGELGGPSLERAAYFGTTTEVDLGDEGRLPPHLNAVGAKLRPEWISEVLLNGGAVRPYMATRMPQFGAANVGHLPELLDRVDDPRPDDPTDTVPLLDAKYGRRLLGIKGMACITCHTYGPYPSLGIPAMDLTQMSHRLKRSWFRDYLIDPASLRPGTRMPSFFPGGKSVNEAIFEGDTERQIQALWGFLEIADASNPPDGLVQGTKEIVASDEAVLYRNFIQGSGPRSIGVGYPEKGNLSFDAQSMRLAMIWQGPFIDAARHSSGRGQGFEPPLGHNKLMLPEGPPLAILPDRGIAWPQSVGKAGGYEFRGYRLDELRRPTFLYSFRNLEIEDFTQAISTELDAKLRRQIRVRSKANVVDVWMRLAVGQSIVEGEDGVFTVDGRLQLKIQTRGPGTPLVRTAATGRELIVPVEVIDGQGQIEIEMVW